ncbi:hypothetical protein Zm00014a_037447, partial [Zea mays]
IHHQGKRSGLKNNP